MIKIRKLMMSCLGLVVLASMSMPGIADAYVYVDGYYRSNGTYVAPHVRSEPNGLKYDNYGYRPSQGLYNSSYGTRGSSWDTPTYITDPDYYIGQSLYNSDSYDSTYISSYEKVTGGYKSYGFLTCSYGYYKSGSQCLEEPDNGYMIGSTLYCDYGYYNNGNYCKKAPENSYTTSYGFTCYFGYKKSANKCVKDTPSYSAYRSYDSSSYSSYNYSDESSTKSDSLKTESSAYKETISHGYIQNKIIYCDSGYGPVGKKCLSSHAYCKGIYGKEAYMNNNNECVYCNEGYEFDNDNKLIAKCVPKI